MKRISHIMIKKSFSLNFAAAMLLYGALLLPWLSLTVGDVMAGQMHWIKTLPMTYLVA